MSRAFNNWKVVLLSIIGATTFWFFNALNKDYDARISYPINFDFQKDQVVVMQPLPTTVSIDVSSGGWNLLRKTFWFNVTPIQIELDNPTEIGYYTRSSLFPIVSDQLKELKVNFLITDTLFIDIEAKRSKKVLPFVDSLTLNLADNHRITSPISIIPDTIELVGPKSFIDTISTEFQIGISSKGINSDYNREIDIDLPWSPSITSEPKRVNVKFRVEKFERFSIEIPIEAQNFPNDSSLFLSTEKVQVFYTVAKSKNEDFSPKDFAITADLKMLDRMDSTVLAILVYHPEELLDIEVIPENIPIRHARR